MKNQIIRIAKAEIEKLSPSSKVLFKDNTPEAVIYNGFQSIKNMLFSMLNELQPNEEYHVIGAMYEEDILGVRPFFKEFHSERALKEIRVKMLANADTKGSIESETFKLAEVNYLPRYLMTNMHIFIYKETVIMILWMKNPIAFYIKSEDAVRSFETYFDTFWKLSKE